MSPTAAAPPIAPMTRAQARLAVLAGERARIRAIRERRIRLEGALPRILWPLIHDERGATHRSAWAWGFVGSLAATLVVGPLGVAAIGVVTMTTVAVVTVM